MSKNIEYIYRLGLVLEIVYNIGKGENKNDLQDLILDVYVILCSLDDLLLDRLLKTKQIRYYIANIVCRLIKSKTSKYYYMYKKFRNSTIPLIDDILKEEIN